MSSKVGAESQIKLAKLRSSSTLAQFAFRIRP